MRECSNLHIEVLWDGATMWLHLTAASFTRELCTWGVHTWCYVRIKKSSTRCSHSCLPRKWEELVVSLFRPGRSLLRPTAGFCHWVIAMTGQAIVQRVSAQLAPGTFNREYLPTSFGTEQPLALAGTSALRFLTTVFYITLSEKFIRELENECTLLPILLWIHPQFLSVFVKNFWKGVADMEPAACPSWAPVTDEPGYEGSILVS